MSRPGTAGWIGRSVPRPDGPDKVSGRAVYPQDRALPEGCLHAATVRAAVASARIEAIDPAPALAVPGVVRVLTAADVRGTNRFGLAEADQPVLVDTHIRGASDVLALVIGTNERAAREGARRVRISLALEVALLDPERALDADAPIVHSERAAPDTHPNLLAHRVVRRGDTAQAMRGAALVVEGVYETEWVEHFFLATEAGLATLDPDGGLTLHVATQWPEADLRQAAAALDEPRESLRIVQETIGGAFGGREDISLQILLLLAARATGSPVRMVWDRPESVRGHGKRHPVRIRHRLAADALGRFMAAEIDVLIDAGCYASTSGQLLDNVLAHACGPYEIGNVAATGRAVLTNNPFGCAFRGFGANQAIFAIEQQVNRVAVALDLDPIEVRRQNLIRTPGVLGLGSKVTSRGGLSATLSLAADAAERAPLPPSDGRLVYGRGIAVAVKNIGFGFGFDDRATADVTLMSTGATVRIGAADVGQGAETVLAQIAATVLDLPLESIQMKWRDTATAPDAGSSSASRQTLASGNAVVGACEQALREAAAAGGLDRVPGGAVTARHTWAFPETRSLGEGAARHLAAFGWATCVADVAVDRSTGEVTVLRVVEAVDAGQVVNPMLFRGQVEGGIVMGQGYALQERFHVKDGMPITRGFEAGGVPTAVDAVPIIETLAVEVPEAIGPFGARGVGEITMIPVVPSLTAAIHDAVGVWIDHLPALPERILAAIESADLSQPSPTHRAKLP